VDRAVDLLRQLVKDFPRVPDYRLDLCETLALSRLGPPERPRDGNPDARKRERLEEAIALSGPLVTEYPNVPDYAAAHGRYLEQLGVALFASAKPDDAEKTLRKAATVQQRLVKQYPEVVAYGFGLSLTERSLGRVLNERREWKEARALLEDAVSRMEALQKKDPRLGAIRPLLGVAYRDLAQALKGSGEVGLAEEALRKSREREPEHALDPFGPRERGPDRER
jgi:tetratricopeptide (TPR) repeat protein